MTILKLHFHPDIPVYTIDNQNEVKRIIQSQNISVGEKFDYFNNAINLTNCKILNISIVIAQEVLCINVFVKKI